MTLYVFELTWPRTWLDDLPDQVAFDVEKMLLLLESALADAAVGLGLFEAEQAAAVRHAQYREQWEQRRAAEAALVARFESQLAPDLPLEERWRLDEQTRERARVEAKRRAGSQGSSLMPTRIACRPCTPSRACTRWTRSPRRSGPWRECPACRQESPRLGITSRLGSPPW
jgi:hypothetical protein